MPQLLAWTLIIIHSEPARFFDLNHANCSDEARRIVANIAKPPPLARYSGKPQLYQSLVQYTMVKAFCSALAARSSASSGISKIRISSSPSASLVISLFMASTPLVLAPIHAYTNRSLFNAERCDRRHTMRRGGIAVSIKREMTLVTTAH